MVATLAYATAFSLVQFLLGVESPVSPLVIREILVGVLLNGLIAMPVFAAVRALLRPDLIDDLRPRRRRRDHAPRAADGRAAHQLRGHDHGPGHATRRRPES